MSFPQSLEKDPQLKALARAVPKDLGELWEKYRKAATDTEKRMHQLNAIEADLAAETAALAGNTDPKQAKRLQQNVQKFIKKRDEVSGRVDQAKNLETEAGKLFLSG